MKNSYVAPELSRPLQVDKISLGGVEERIVASAQERAALVRRFGLKDITRLEAFLTVQHGQNSLLEVTGSLKADVIQSCVVTLEPLNESIDETIDVLFAPSHMLAKNGAVTEWSDLEPPEPIENGIIDLGELVAQHLATALNPYPRKEGAVFERALTEEGAGPKENPFAQLKLVVKNDEKSKG